MDTTRRITRSRTNRTIAGVASGLASYFGVDPLFVRLAFLILALFNGFGALLYIVLWLIVPNEGEVDPRGNVQVAIDEMQAGAEQAVDRVRSAFQR